jgi:hypothetical protein
LENSRADFRTLQDENNQEIKELKMKMALAADHAKLEAMRLADRQCDALQVELREKYEQEMADMQTRFVSEQEKFKTLLAEFELFKLLSAKEMEQQQIESEEKSTKIKELILRNEVNLDGPIDCPPPH